MKMSRAFVGGRSALTGARWLPVPGPVRDQPTRVLGEKPLSRLTPPRPSGRPFAATRLPVAQRAPVKSLRKAIRGLPDFLSSTQSPLRIVYRFVVFVSFVVL